MDSDCLWSAGQEVHRPRRKLVLSPNVRRFCVFVLKVDVTSMRSGQQASVLTLYILQVGIGCVDHLKMLISGAILPVVILMRIHSDIVDALMWPTINILKHFDYRTTAFYLLWDVVMVSCCAAVYQKRPPDIGLGYSQSVVLNYYHAPRGDRN